MKSYIGTKIVQAEIVQAEPQDDPKHDHDKSPPTRPERGYRVVYEDGYVSWSPKATFERSNREITEAEKALIFTDES